MQRQTSSRAKSFWRRLGQSYGARMADQYGPTCPPDWAEIIDRTDDERLQKALVVIRRDYLQFPPTLGQFEAAIPRKQFNGDRESVMDRLAAHAVKALSLCEHQLPRPWNYFGKRVDNGGRFPDLMTTGVVIPACDSEGCPHYGKSHRILTTDLPQEVIAA